MVNLNCIRGSQSLPIITGMRFEFVGSQELYGWRDYIGNDNYAAWQAMNTGIFLTSIGNIFPNVQQLVVAIVSGVTNELVNNLKHGITGHMLESVKVGEVGYGKGGEQLSIGATRNLTTIIPVLTDANRNLTTYIGQSNDLLSSGDFWIVVTLILIGLFGLLWFIEDLIHRRLAFKSNKKSVKKSVKKSAKKALKKSVKKSSKKSVKKSSKKALKKSAKKVVKKSL
jgi:hypothetical protein